ncbi:LamG-like jellyroll fold domain-containing protein, partial [Kitasatospora sp. NPDC056076]|uniref:LamG-like jellyroll fold domain-containing protein n=1 Tax=Kitasatospora sp. NPDC056076 TaxID=3345703 RepID=UPI0035D9E0A0
FFEAKSSDFSCTNKYTVDLKLTTAIDGSTTWNNSPTVLNGIGSADVGGAGQSGCGTTQFDYDVTGVYRQFVADNGSLTFGLFARNESDSAAFKRLTYNPAVVIEYDRIPNTPTNPNVWPVPSTAVPWSDNQGCDGSLGWINSSVGFNGSVNLNTTVSSNAQNALGAWAHIWDYANQNADADSGYTATVANGSVASFQVKPGVIQDGHVYGWNAKATDGLSQMSASTPTCRFGVDLTPPTLTVPDTTTKYSDADLANVFPPSGNGQVTKKHIGDTGTVPFTAADPAPGGNASGVVCARWSFDPQFSGASWACGSDFPANGLQVHPTRWGTNIVYIQVMDNARNVSPVAQYSFYVPWNPNGPPPVFGDVTGDGAPDILAPDQAGYLRAYNVPGNPNARSAPMTTVASAAAAPGGKGWNGIQLTHRGTLTGGNNIDDVIAHAPGDTELKLYPNPGNTGVYGRIDKPVALAKPKCAKTATEDCSWLTTTGYNATDWSTTLRIAALGDPVNTDLDPKLGFKNKTGLLTVESTNNGTDAALWYYPATNANTLGKPVRLAATGWKDKELITPGDWAKQGHPGLWTRNLAASTDAAKDDLNGLTFTTGTVLATDNQGQPVNDPTGKPLMVPTLTGIATNAKIGYASTSTWTSLGSDGDITGSGNAALWGTKADGSIDIWWGRPTTPGNPTAGYVWEDGPGTVASTAVNPSQWTLDGRTSGDTGDADKNPLYPNGDPATTYPAKAAFTTDHNGTAGKATVFNGSTLYRTKNAVAANGTTPGLDTTQSYTVSAWVKLNTLTNMNGYPTILSVTGQEQSPFYLQYSKNLGNWTFVLPDSDNYNTGGYFAAYDRTGRTKAQTGVWTHLTGSYNALTRIATLYVNGSAVGSTQVSSTFKAHGAVNIGGAISDRYPGDNYIDGAVSDVRVYPYALTDPQVNTVATTDSSVQIHSALPGTKCLDGQGGAQGALLAINDCSNGDGQHFTLTSDNKIKVSTGLCLGTAGTPVANGTRVTAQLCGDPTVQNWTRRYDGSLVHQASGLCLDVHGWDTTNGSALDLWDCNGAANERWYAEAQTK